MSLFKEAFAVAFDSLRDIDGVEVVYRRKGGEQFTLLVSPGSTRIETATSDGDGVVVTKTSDYIIKRSEFEAAAGGKHKPESGDQILESVDGQIFVMDVRSVLGSGVAREPHGQFHDAWRVTTKQIATES